MLVEDVRGGYQYRTGRSACRGDELVPENTIRNALAPVRTSGTGARTKSPMMTFNGPADSLVRDRMPADYAVCGQIVTMTVQWETALGRQHPGDSTRETAPGSQRSGNGLPASAGMPCAVTQTGVVPYCTE